MPQADPTWSPDGSNVLFGGAANDTAAVIRILDVTTHQISIIPGSQGLFSPRWSPDGQFIVALLADSTRLLIFDFETQKWTELMKGSIGWPEWSNDSRYVFVLDFSGGGLLYGLLKIHLSNHRVEQAFDLKNVSTTGYDVGSWFSLTPDNSAMLLRNIGTWDVYSLDWEAP